MPALSTSDVLLRDPLSKETRSERRTLLGASAVGIVIVKTGLVPSKIAALGIEFSQADQRSLLLAIAGVVCYFLVAFFVYAGSDFLAWRIAFRKAVKDQLAESRLRETKGVDDHDLVEEIRRRYPRTFPVYSLSTPMSISRALFEFVLPFALGIYAVILLFRANV